MGNDGRGLPAIGKSAGAAAAPVESELFRCRDLGAGVICLHSGYGGKTETGGAGKTARIPYPPSHRSSSPFWRSIFRSVNSRGLPWAEDLSSRQTRSSCPVQFFRSPMRTRIASRLGLAMAAELRLFCRLSISAHGEWAPIGSPALRAVGENRTAVFAEAFERCPEYLFDRIFGYV